MLFIAKTIILELSFALCDGQIIVNANGGESPYLYSLFNSSYAIDNIFTSLNYGTYYVSVTDANGCTNDTILAINNANAPTLSDSTINVDCNGNSSGEIYLTISGTNSFTIDWDNDGVGDNDDLPDLSGLQAGIYSVVVNDLSTGCVAALSVVVFEPGIFFVSG